MPGKLQGPVTKEFEARKAAERAKALRKYGEDAILPAGRPDLDITDYMTNELVGLVRYSEMLEARSRMMLDAMEGLAKPVRDALKDAIALAREVEAASARHAFDIIAIRQRLKKHGLHLGLTEAAA